MDTNACIKHLTHALTSLGATVVGCGEFQCYDIRPKYGAPELNLKRPRYTVIILPDASPDTTDSSARQA